MNSFIFDFLATTIAITKLQNPSPDSDDLTALISRMAFARCHMIGLPVGVQVLRSIIRVGPMSVKTDRGQSSPPAWIAVP